MKYYGYFRSSAAFRLRIAFNLKSLSPEMIPIHLTRNGGEQKTDEFRKINPQAMVPALETDGTILTQSMAILEWLEETHPQPAILPSDPIQRAKVRAFAQVIACDIHPLQNLRVLSYLRQDLKLDEAAVLAWINRWLTDGLTACEQLLADQPKTRFCFGDAPSLADICLAPQLFSAARFKVDLTNMPRLRAVQTEMDNHPAFTAAQPGAQPDAE
ncbi:MAG: maleylacetoacetate isomerase [Alphaproteobacteria bacterium]|nr:maleylacetoacetate isomerase [Alphaproteobacteria bacterium]